MSFPEFIRPLPRELFEAGYRVTQMIPWVNIVVPFANIGANLQAALNGDKNATQRIVNNLIMTIQPVAIIYYGYNEIADLLNLEQPALNLQTWVFTTAWNVLDPFSCCTTAASPGCRCRPPLRRPTRPTAPRRPHWPRGGRQPPPAPDERSAYAATRRRPTRTRSGPTTRGRSPSRMRCWRREEASSPRGRRRWSRWNRCSVRPTRRCTGRPRSFRGSTPWCR